jgi:hypothetical protein
VGGEAGGLRVGDAGGLSVGLGGGLSEGLGSGDGLGGVGLGEGTVWVGDGCVVGLCVGGVVVGGWVVGAGGDGWTTGGAVVAIGAGLGEGLGLGLGLGLGEGDRDGCGRAMTDGPTGGSPPKAPPVGGIDRPGVSTPPATTGPALPGRNMNPPTRPTTSTAAAIVRVRSRALRNSGGRCDAPDGAVRRASMRSPSEGRAGLTGPAAAA